MHFNEHIFVSINKLCLPALLEKTLLNISVLRYLENTNRQNYNGFSCFFRLFFFKVKLEINKYWIIKKNKHDLVTDLT